MAALLLLQPSLSAAAEIVAAGDGDRRPGVTEANNGTPVVNIANPNGQGLSHNLYDQFNVDGRGVILNNSRTVTDTQQAGLIEGNPNLRNGSAGVILNEVISANPSQLNGYLEVGGAAADVIVANPWGITCDGCGFINTHRATFTTGVPRIHDGRLQGYSVDRGQVRFQGDGLNADNIDRFDVIARSVELNARLRARDLNLVTGTQNVDAANLSISEERAVAGQPEFAISSSALGGIYGDRIELIANEQGVGVNLRAPVAAQNGNIRLTANGDIRHGDLQAVGDIVVDAGENRLEASGRSFAEGNYQAEAGRFLNSGNLFSGGSFSLAAETVSNRGILGGQAGLSIHADSSLVNGWDGALDDEEGAGLFSGGDIELFAPSLTNLYGDIYARGDLRIAGKSGGIADLLENRSGLIEAEGNVDVRATRIRNVRDQLEIDEKLTEGWLKSTCHECSGDHFYMTYLFTERFENEVKQATGASHLVAGEDLSLTGDTLTNETSNVLAYGDMSLNLRRIENIGLNTGPWERKSKYGGYMNDGHHVDNVVLGIIPYNRRNFTGEAHYWGVGADKDAEMMSLTWNGQNPYYDPDNLYLRKNNYVHRANRHWWTKDLLIDGESKLLGANIVAAGNLDTHSAKITNGDFGHKLEGGVGQSGVTSVANPLPGEKAANQLDGLVNGALFHYTTADHPWLVETNPFFTTLEGFYGSEYLLRHLGWDPDGTIRRLGDGFFEQKLIREQILRETGRVFLDEKYADANEQYKALLDQGIYAAEEMGLAIGVALSPSQINRLNEDIVWMVEKQVAGETVLAPQLYLSPNSTTTDNKGALIAAGGDLTNDGGSIENADVIESDGRMDLALDEDGLRNIGGTIRAADELAVRSDGDIVNLSGRLQADMVSLSAAGDIENRRFTVREDLGIPGAEEWRTRYADAAVIEGESGFSLDADGDIRISGSEVRGGKGSLKAGGDVEIDTVALDSGRKGAYYGGKLDQQRIRHLGSTLSATLDLLVEAESNLNIIGSEVRSDQSVALSAGEDINILSASNRKRNNFVARHDGETSIRKRSQVRQQKSLVQAGQNLSVRSGGDLLAVASDFEAGEDISLTSKGNMALMAAKDRDYSYTYEEDDKWYGSKTRVSEEYSDSLVSTSLKGSGDILLNTAKTEDGSIAIYGESMGNVLLESVAVSSGGDFAAYAGEDILVAAGTERSFRHEETRRDYKSYVKSFSAVAGAAMASLANAQLYGAAKKVGFELAGDHLQGEGATRVVDGRFETGGDNILLAGNDVSIIAGDLESQKFSTAVGLKQGNVGHVTLGGVQDHSYHYDKKTTFKFGGQMDGGIVSFSSKEKEKSRTEVSRWHGTRISVRDGMSFSGGGNLEIHGGSLEGSGDLSTDMGGEILMLDGMNSSRYTHSSEDDGSVGSFRNREDAIQRGHAVVTKVNMDGDVNIDSDGDQWYRGTIIENSGDQTLKSGGKIHFADARDRRFESHTRESSDTAWVSASGEGEVAETMRHVVLQNGGKRMIQAAEGIEIDVENLDKSAIEDTVDQLVRKDPDLAWLKDVQEHGDIDWNRVKALHESWDYESEGLGQGAALAITIVATAMTGGVGGSVADAVTGAAASAGAGTAVGAGLGAAAQAGFQSAVTQTAIGTINNGGKLDRALADLGRDDYLNNIGASMLSAGLATSVVDPTFDLAFGDIRTDNIYGVTRGFELNSLPGAAGFTAHAGAQALSRAVVNDMIQGGSFEDYLEASLEQQGNNVLSALAFNRVGEIADGASGLAGIEGDTGAFESMVEGGVGRTLLHGVTGGIVTEITEGDFATGAAAAGLNQMMSKQLGDAAESLGTSPSRENDWRMAGAQLAGLMGATLTEGDVNTGAWIAKQADVYNRQLHSEELSIIAESYEEYAEKRGISPEQALRELVYYGYVMVDKGVAEDSSQKKVAFYNEYNESAATAFLLNKSWDHSKIVHSDGVATLPFIATLDQYETSSVNRNHLWDIENVGGEVMGLGSRPILGVFHQDGGLESYWTAYEMAENEAADGTFQTFLIMPKALFIPVGFGGSKVIMEGSKYIIAGGVGVSGAGYINAGKQGALGAAFGYGEIISGTNMCAAYVTSCWYAAPLAFDGFNNVYKAVTVGSDTRVEDRSIYSMISEETFEDYRYGESVDLVTDWASPIKGLSYGLVKAATKSGYEFVNEGMNLLSGSYNMYNGIPAMNSENDDEK